MSEGKIHRESDRWIGAGSLAMRTWYPAHCGEEGALGSDRKDEITDTNSRNEFPL